MLENYLKTENWKLKINKWPLVIGAFKGWKLKITKVALITLLVSSVPVQPAHAASCSASVSPSSLNPNQAANLDFSVTNSGAADVLWVQITSPSNHFQVNGGSSSGWSASAGSSSVTYTGGTLAASGSHTFRVSVQTGLSSTSGSWTVQVSESADGSGSASCSGDTTVTITGDTTDPVISNIAASDITTSGATITWTTDESASSRVRYGTTTSYGSTETSGSLKTSHSIPLTGLSAGTTYHYQVESTDAAGNTATSSDKVFTTTSNQTNPPSISNLTVQNIGTSSATISWNTNQPATSELNYGPTTSYGSTKTNSNFKTSHSYSLSGLSADTTYHYRVRVTNSDNETTTTSDNTFTTAAESSSGGGGGGSSGGDSPPGSGGGEEGVAPSSPSKSTSSSSGTDSGSSGSSSPPGSGGDAEEVAPFTPPPDTSAPTISLTTDFSRPYPQPPEVTGTASDNRSVRSISYSLDGGQNWLPVSNISGPLSNRTFTATLPALEDGNYQIRARAFDSAGNVGLSSTYTLVIDQLPPLIGTSLYAVGAQSLTASQDQINTVIAGLDQRITVSAIGGATAVDIIARATDGSGAEQVFSLVQNPDSGLWTGTISLANIGNYELIARAKDGANNQTERRLRSISAISGGQLLAGGQPVAGAEVTVYYLDELSKSFLPWNAEPFRQQNPQTTADDGQFRFFLPPGTYYVLAQAQGLKTTQTEIFTLERNTAIQPVISMAQQKYLNLGLFRLPLSIFNDTVALEISPPNIGGAGGGTEISSPDKGRPGGVSPILGEENSLPNVTLLQNNQPVALPDLITGPTILTLLTDWSPVVSEQLSQIDVVNSPPSLGGARGGTNGEGVRILPILIQSSPTRASLLKNRGQYQTDLLVDPLGDLAANLNVDTTPTHVFINAEGQVTGIKTGLLSAEELSNQF